MYMLFIWILVTTYLTVLFFNLIIGLTVQHTEENYVNNIYYENYLINRMKVFKTYTNFTVCFLLYNYSVKTFTKDKISANQEYNFEVNFNDLNFKNQGLQLKKIKQSYYKTKTALHYSISQ